MPLKDLEERRKYNSYYHQTIRRDKSEYKYGDIKKSARNRSIEFHITYIEYVSTYWRQTCFYCPTTDTRGIDRIDSSKGYSLDNCVPCCSMCNQMKFDNNFNDFINHINLIAAKSGSFRID